MESCVEDFVLSNWEKYDAKKTMELNDIQSYNLLSDMNRKQTIDLAGFKFIFNLMDTNKDESLDQEEFQAFAMDLIKDSMPPTKEILLVMMHENLIAQIDEKYTPIPKFFTGDEEERVEWVKNVIQEIIELSWHHFGKDKDGQLGEDETFKLIQDLQPKSKLD